MSAMLILALIAAAPVALTLFMRSNAAIIFFALCTGSVLEQYASGSATLVASSVTTQSNTSSFVHIGLLVLPALITLVLLRKSISAAKTPLNVLPAVALGLVTALLVVPLLPGGVQTNIMNLEVWKQLNNYADFIIAAGTGIALVVLALTYKIPKNHKKHH